jgi:hypothetical protein
MLRSMNLTAEDGVREDIHYDDVDDKFILSRKDDVSDFLRGTAALRHEADTGNRGYSPSGDWRRAASLSPAIVVDWLNKGINIFDPNATQKMLALLDSSEFERLRTAPGVLSSRPARKFFGRW